MDLEGGNDSNDGTTFANRWLTFTSGATAARTAPGDTIRIMASPEPTQVGSCKWTKRPSSVPGTVAITSSTNASPINIQATAHGLVTGDIARVVSHTTNTEANGLWVVTRVDDNNVTLDDSVGNGVGGAAGTIQNYNHNAISIPDGTVTKMITPACTNTGWTASANVTLAQETSARKIDAGPIVTNGALKVTVATAFTTGLAAYYTLTSTDFSGYQQITFWVKVGTAIADSRLSIKLCSDTAGATPVDTFTVPASVAANFWYPVTVDKGSALGSAIQSIAIYVDTDLSTTANVDCYFSWFLACKASSAADSLTLNSLFGKAMNLSWEASTTYAADVIRRPTPTNRNGFVYKVTAGGGGASHSAEPTWPTKLNDTVTDNALTWTCIGLEESWYPINLINNKVVFFDYSPAHIFPASTTRGYQGDSETVDTWKRQPIRIGPVTSAVGTAWANGTINESGTEGNQITYEGGWNRTDMSSQGKGGETWLDFGNGFTKMLAPATGKSYLTFKNINLTRGYTICEVGGGAGNFPGIKFHSCHISDCGTTSGTASIALNNSSFFPNFDYFEMIGCVVTNSLGYLLFPIFTNQGNNMAFKRCAHYNNWSTFTFSVHKDSVAYDCWARNSFTFGFTCDANSKLIGCFGDNNTSADVAYYGNVFGYDNLFSSTIEATPPATTRLNSGSFSSGKHDNTLNNDTVFFDGGLATKQSSVTQPGSGYAWQIDCLTTGRYADNPIYMPIARVAVNASALVTVTAYVRRTNTNLTIKLVTPERQLAGMPTKQSATISAAADTWEQLTNTFTPTEAGVVEVGVEVYATTATTYSAYVDTVAITQA